MKVPEVLAAAAAATTNITITTKIGNATEGLPSNCFDRLHKVCNKQKQNALTICDYIFSLRSEINPSDNYRKVIVMLLCNLSLFFNDNNNNNTKKFLYKDQY